MRNVPFLAFILFFLVSCATAPRVPQTTLVERAKFKKELIETTIEGGLSQPLTRETEAKWNGAFWGMNLARYKSENTTKAIRAAFARWDSESMTFQRSLLEVVYALYPDDFVPEMAGILRTTKSEKLFAMAALHTLRAGHWNDSQRIMDQMSHRFSGYYENPILRMLSYEIQQSSRTPPEPPPPIVDLLSAPFEKGKPVIFSLQRKNRHFPGLAILRDANGKFAKLNGSKYFSIQQLALATSDLPGYLSNGNTPQGIFSVQGFGLTQNIFIGPTPNVQTRLPFEVEPFEYFHTTDASDSVWTKERYESLLPASWRNYLPIYTAFYAGEAGRNEIIVHGTTVDPQFYKDETYFPNTPSLGCLCAPESWSPTSGKRVSSEQQKLVDAMKKIGFEKGYLVVAELNNEPRPVTLEDVVPLIVLAGRKGSP